MHLQTKKERKFTVKQRNYVTFDPYKDDNRQTSCVERILMGTQLRPNLGELIFGTNEWTNLGGLIKLWNLLQPNGLYL